MVELVRIGMALAQIQPFEYGLAPGVLRPSHVEDIAKDLLDSARSGFRQGIRTEPLPVPLDEQAKQRRKRIRERAKRKAKERERGASLLSPPIPKVLMISGAYSDVESEGEDGPSGGEQKVLKAQTPHWRNPDLTRAYVAADWMAG